MEIVIDTWFWLIINLFFMNIILMKCAHIVADRKHSSLSIRQISDKIEVVKSTNGLVLKIHKHFFGGNKHLEETQARQRLAFSSTPNLNNYYKK